MRGAPRRMRNSSLHSFSLRLHFHAQYLQNKAYKHLMAKIFPEQLRYLALPAPFRFPNASRVLPRSGGESGGEKLPTRTRSSAAVAPHAALPPRTGPALPQPAARSRGCRQRGCFPTLPPTLPARRHHADGAPRAPPAGAAPLAAPKRRAAGGPAGKPGTATEGGERASGLSGRSWGRLAAGTCRSAWKRNGRRAESRLSLPRGAAPAAR